MMIGELSRRAGVNIETIRYYEKRSLLPQPRRTAGGRRVYDADYERRLRFIRRAREIGFSLDEVRMLLELSEPSHARCGDVCAIAAEHLTGIRARIADLQRLERTLALAMDRCTTRDASDCGVIDALLPV